MTSPTTNAASNQPQTGPLQTALQNRGDLFGLIGGGSAFTELLTQLDAIPASAVADRPRMNARPVASRTTQSAETNDDNAALLDDPQTAASTTRPAAPPPQTKPASASHRNSDGKETAAQATPQDSNAESTDSIDNATSQDTMLETNAATPTNAAPDPQTASDATTALTPQDQPPPLTPPPSHDPAAPASVIVRQHQITTKNQQQDAAPDEDAAAMACATVAPTAEAGPSAAGPGAAGTDTTRKQPSSNVTPPTAPSQPQTQDDTPNGSRNAGEPTAAADQKSAQVAPEQNGRNTPQDQNPNAEHQNLTPIFSAQTRPAAATATGPGEPTLTPAATAKTDPTSLRLLDAASGRPTQSYDATAQLTAPKTARASALNATQVLEQVTVKLNQQARNGQDQITIQLRPADLGRVDIKLHFHDGAVTGTVTADQQSTLDMLAKDSRSLERALQEAGLRADPGSLSFQLRDSGQQAAQRNAQDAPSRQADGFDAPDATTDDVAPLTMDVAIIEPNRVNLRV